jgi:hypothetical protein
MRAARAAALCSRDPARLAWARQLLQPGMTNDFGTISFDNLAAVKGGGR